jgi:hypothetical protein
LKEALGSIDIEKRTRSKNAYDESCADFGYNRKPRVIARSKTKPSGGRRKTRRHD